MSFLNQPHLAEKDFAEFVVLEISIYCISISCTSKNIVAQNINFNQQFNIDGTRVSKIGLNYRFIVSVTWTMRFWDSLENFRICFL